MLYGTNHFHFTGIHLLRNLDKLLRPEHLALVKSATMIWALDPVSGLVIRPPSDGQDHSADKRFYGWYNFSCLLQSVPAALPNLRFLHIALREQWHSPAMAQNDAVRRCESDLLKPLDDMVRRFPLGDHGFIEINLALPQLTFEVMKDFLLRSGKSEETGDSGVHIRIWRPVDPGPGEEVSKLETCQKGYWCLPDMDFAEGIGSCCGSSS